MRGLFAGAITVLALFVHLTGAQQYMGDPIPNSLPNVTNSEITYWKIKDGIKNNVTLINYMSHGSNGQRLIPANIKRAVIIIHGLNEDPGTYEANMLSALSQVSDPNINFDNVAIVAPYFANGDGKNIGYPWVDGLSPGRGSISNCLVWKSSQWSAGANNQYPYFSTNISSYAVLDQMVQYFDNVTMFPNMQQIVVAGHSLGAQTVQRYAALGQPLNTHSPVSYWVANPDSYVWFSTSRPLSTASCSIYDNYREGYTNFSSYPMTYGLSLVNSGRANILANFNSKSINYARGTQDLGDDASTCAAETTGINRNERFFNFIKAFPPSCQTPSGRSCDTIDFVNAGHDAGTMMASAAGLARLFQDNFYGNGSRAFDFGYPRQQQGDDPYPNPALNASTSSTNNQTYAGNMTYWGCWSDQAARSLTNMTYDSSANTIELCTSTCAQGNNTIAGLEFGTQCFCGTSLGYQATQVIQSSCQMPCAGNSNETCGDQNRLSLFSAGRPPISAQPGTPETVGNFYYSNCYTEGTNGRALSGASTSGSFVSLEYCESFCSGFKYFGTEYADECYCGNSFAAGANVTSDNDCSMICAGSNSEFCGAGNRLTVYVNPNWVQGTSSSSSSSSTVASATSSGTSSTATGISCPASNNTVVTSYGQNFTIECGIDHQGGDLSSLTVNSFQQCIDTCSQNSQCVDVSLSGTACYLKSVLGAPGSSPVVWGAKLISPPSSSSSSSSTSISILNTASASSSSALTSSLTTASTSSAVSSSSSIPFSTSFALSTSTVATSSSQSATPSAISCPGSNSTVYTTNGQTFLIECGVDHFGGDMASQSVPGFSACIDLCAATIGCVDVSLSGAMCYMKSSVGAPVYNGVFGAKFLSAASSSSAVPTSSILSTSSAIQTSSNSIVSSPSASSTPSSTSSVSSASSIVPASTSSASSSSSDTSSPTSSGFSAASTASGTSSVQSTLSSSSSDPASTSSTISSTSSVVSSSSTSVSTISSSSASTSSISSTAAPSSTASSSSASPASASVPTTLSTVTTTSSTSSTSSASATPTALRCPASNNTIYTAPAGQNFLIECGIDHAAGDMGMVYVSNFTQCVNTCGSTTGCVDVSLSGAACYMKKTLGAANANSGILGAKLIVGGT